MSDREGVTPEDSGKSEGSKPYIVCVTDYAVSILGPFGTYREAGRFGDAIITDPRWNVVELDPVIEQNPLFRGKDVPTSAMNRERLDEIENLVSFLIRRGAG